MQNENTKRIWQAPWGYPESFAVVGGIVIVGLVLQMVVGSFDFFLLVKPINLFMMGLVLLASIIIGLKAKYKSLARWFSGVAMSVSLIVAMLLLTIIMGLTPQITQSTTALGFEAMTSNWAFVIVYTLLLISLGALIVRRVMAFRFKDMPFYLNHLGLWLFLAASGLGYADMQRYIMFVNEGDTQWRVYDNENNIQELPIAITLNDFSMEVYNPKLAVIDRSTGEVQPTVKPEYLQIDENESFGELAGWDVEIVEYIHKAVRNSDDSYHEVHMPGSTPAVRVAVSRDKKPCAEGWVCGGNSAQLHMTLALSEDYSLVMTAPEPRLFRSKVEVYTKEGDNISAEIEVNKPLSVGSWTIYQYGYDNAAGNLSSYSSFELVYDAWILPVYIGIAMMMLGSVAMILIGRKIGGEKHDVE